MKKNILVFPCGSEIGLDIYSSVCYSTYFHLIGGSSVDDHGKFVYEDYIPDIPFANTPEFIPTMAEIVKERNIDAIYPAMDLVITILKEHEQELGCKVVASPVETTQICLSQFTPIPIRILNHLVLKHLRWVCISRKATLKWLRKRTRSS